MTQNCPNPRQGAGLPRSVPSRHWLMAAGVGGGEWKYKLGGISLQSDFSRPSTVLQEWQVQAIESPTLTVVMVKRGPADGINSDTFFFCDPPRLGAPSKALPMSDLCPCSQHSTQLSRHPGNVQKVNKCWLEGAYYSWGEK